MKLLFAFGLLWQILSGYEVAFSGAGAEGTFSGLQGTIDFDPAMPEAAVFDVTIDAASINTGNDTKDKHARSDSWFATDNYPTIRLRSTRVSKSGSGYQLTGLLNMHGVEKEISFPFTFTETVTGAEFTGSFTVSRKDFGIKGPWYGFTVGDDFTVQLKVPVQLK
jgi:polyisoprenoid-binding protein YceI